MAKLWIVGDTLEALGAAWLGPIILGGAIVAVAASPEMRRRIRTWSVQGVAMAMAAGEMAGRGAKDAGEGTGGIVNQLGQRIVQSAAELREEWEDFLAEARSAKHRITQASNGKQAASGENTASENSGPTRRRTSRPRPRRTSG